MAETPMIASDKTREVKRQRNDQDDGPGRKRLSFTRLFVFPIFCGHDPLLCPGVDHDSGRTFDSRLWERSHLAKEAGSVLTISGYHVTDVNRSCKAEERPVVEGLIK